MTRRTRLIAAAAAIFLIGLIVLFPARVAYRWFAPDTIQLSGISGTIWNGAAREGASGGLYLGNVRWRFRPLALLTGKAGYAIAAEPVSGFVEAHVAVSPGGTIHFSNLATRLPAAALENLVPEGVDGIISLDFDSFAIRDGFPVDAMGTVEVANLVVRGLTSSPLGDYRAVFQTADDVITGEVQDVSGVLDLIGTIELRPDRSYILSGQVAATNAAPASVVQQLQYLGSPNAAGQRSFRFEGRL